MDIDKNTLGSDNRQRSRVVKWLKNHWIPVVIGLFLGTLLSLSLAIILPLRNFAARAEELKPQAGEIMAAVNEKDLTKIKAKINEMQTELKQLDEAYQGLFLVKHLPYFKTYYQDGEKVFAAGQEGLKAGLLVVKAIEPYQDFLGLDQDDGLTGDGEKTAEDRIDFLVEGLTNIKPELEEISQRLTAAENYLNEIDADNYPEEFRGIKLRPQIISTQKMVSDINLLVSQGGPLIEKADWLMGVDEPRNYLLIFQNDAELRPTGGFWTAYGILEIDDGDVIPKISENIYNLDNVFNSRIEPPRPIKEYHKNVYYWHLRDMNLSPSFKESIETFTEYYNELPNAIEYDGVIAIDTQVLVDLINALGGIGVPGWGNYTGEPDDRCWGCPQVIYRLQDYATRPLPTMREDRKAFLSPMMHSIIANALGSPKEKVAELAQVVFDNFNQKHLLAYFPDDDLQQAVEKLNIGGTLTATDDKTDYFHLNDSNFAGAKSNMFIEQQVEQDYQIEDNKIIKTVTVTYKNTAPPSNCNLEAGELCLNGLYRNWFRFYVPEGSELIDMKGSEVEPVIYTESGKTVFEGFYGDTYPLHPKGSTRVSITYQLPFEAGNSLNLLVQKQPGTDNPLYKIFVNESPVEEFNLTTDRELNLSL